MQSAARSRVRVRVDVRSTSNNHHKQRLIHSEFTNYYCSFYNYHDWLKEKEKKKQQNK
jgi:hypothetical protein